MLVGSMAMAQSQQSTLLSAGLTPDSPFYFLDRWGESIQSFFTFNPENKARLEISFASERAAEIKALLVIKGVQSKEVEVAQNLLDTNLSRTASILAELKKDGKDVSVLAKELDDKFAEPSAILGQALKGQQLTLKTQKDELKTKIEEARKTGNTTLLVSFVKQLDEIKAQEELLDQKEKEQKQNLNKQTEAIEEQMSVKDEVVHKIAEMEKEKSDMVSEAQKKGLDVSAVVFNQFDNFIVQAKEALGRGQYEEAIQLAKLAEQTLEYVSNNIDRLEKAQENDSELKIKVDVQKADALKKVNEAGKGDSEKIKEETKQSAEKLREEQKKASEEVKHAEEQLKEVGPAQGSEELK